jgi:hypothetical protein
MITHWESVRFAAWSFLGMIALTTTFVAMLYTTASDALGAFTLIIAYSFDPILEAIPATRVVAGRDPFPAMPVLGARYTISI